MRCGYDVYVLCGATFQGVKFMECKNYFAEYYISKTELDTRHGDDDEKCFC